MTNPIDPWSRTTLTPSVQRQAADKGERTSASRGTPAPAPAAGDQLELSAVAQQASVEPADTEPAFDRAKLEAIKQAVQNGQYPLDARRIAESFLAIEQMIRD